MFPPTVCSPAHTECHAVRARRAGRPRVSRRGFVEDERDNKVYETYSEGIRSSMG